MIRCTGLTAVHCPLHGDCTCPRHEDGAREGEVIEGMNYPTCPLHGEASDHPVEGRTLRELAEAAVDASQSRRRELMISPAEYNAICREVQLPHVHSTTWDPLVFEIARERGLRIPLPDVKVTVDTLR
jgi:hypothetical protein